MEKTTFEVKIQKIENKKYSLCIGTLKIYKKIKFTYNKYNNTGLELNISIMFSYNIKSQQIVKKAIFAESFIAIEKDKN